MKIRSQHRGQVTILEPKGKITIGKGDIALREAVEEALSSGRQNILIDLNRATHMDSSGMAELIAAYNKVRESGGSLKLLRLPPKIQNVLGITQLMAVFDIFDDEQEALASFD